MNYRIIGDIHGRSNWKSLVSSSKDTVNVFVGDYFDPYDNISIEKLIENFNEILEFNKKYENCIFLLGNHDLHYYWGNGMSSTSRFDYKNFDKLHSLFNSNKNLFRLAYSIDNKYLITHAGVSKQWAKNRLPKDLVIDPVSLETAINQLLSDNDIEAFAFAPNADRWDYYGNSPQQSPVWIRLNTLTEENIFANTKYVQIIGHTQIGRVEGFDNQGMLGKDIYAVDCLGVKSDCLLIDSSEDLVISYNNFLDLNQFK